jgi:hypothetical protein
MSGVDLNSVLRHVGQRDEDANLDRGFHRRPGRPRQETPRLGRPPPHFATDFSLTLFEKMPMPQALSETRTTFEEDDINSRLNLFGF